VNLTPEIETIVQRTAKRFAPRDRPDLEQEARIAIWQLSDDTPVKMLNIIIWRRMVEAMRAMGGKTGSHTQHVRSPGALTEKLASNLAGDGQRDFEIVDARLDAHAALRAMPRRQRKALALRYLHELPLKECARRLGVTYGGLRWICLHGSDRPYRGEPKVQAPVAPKEEVDVVRSIAAHDRAAFLRSLPWTHRLVADAYFRGMPEAKMRARFVMRRRELQAYLAAIRRHAAKWVRAAQAGQAAHA